MGGAPCHEAAYVARRTQRGYVLILTLVVLAIAGTLLAAACRASLRKALLAARAERELQARWGMLSCRAALLPQAERVFEEQEEPVTTIRREIRLGSQRFVLVFGDEQAKANVNTLWRGGRAEAERAVRALTQAAGVNHQIELRPAITSRTADAAPDDEPPPPFIALGQVFGDMRPEELAGINRDARSAVQNLTCWGDGTLNFTRASRAALVAVCGQHLGGADVEKLLKFRAEQPESGSADALDQLNLPEERRTAIEDLLSDSSTCYSLWIIASPGNAARYELSVIDALSDSDGPITFAW